MVLGRASVILAKEMIGDLKIVGYTSIAVEISLYVLRIIGTSVFFAALPSGVRYLANDDLNRLDRFLELAWRYGNMLIFPLAFGFLFIGNKLIGIFVGEEYVAGVPLMFSFLPSAIILFWLQAHIHILIIYEKKQALLYSNLISVLGFIVMAMILVARIGIYGLPLSLAIGLFIGYGYAYYRTSSFSTIKNYLSSILKPIGSGLVMILVMMGLKRISLIHWAYFIPVGAIFYIISMVLIKGISKEDYLKVKAAIFS